MTMTNSPSLFSTARRAIPYAAAAAAVSAILLYAFFVRRENMVLGAAGALAGIVAFLEAAFFGFWFMLVLGLIEGRILGVRGQETRAEEQAKSG